MTSGDALFFYQLILPICNPGMLGIEDDPRLAYYTEVERFTNVSKCESGMGASYGHMWNMTMSKELANFDGILVHDGILGSSEGDFHCHWNTKGCAYSSDIANAMTMTQFGELKCAMKLCNNNTAKKGEKKDMILLISMIYNFCEPKIIP
eukprot:11816341-Ditylum_brightwellii.AAC.1